MISKGGILSEHWTLMLCTVGYDDSIAMYRNGLSGCTSRAGGGLYLPQVGQSQLMTAGWQPRHLEWHGCSKHTSLHIHPDKPYTGH